MIAARLWQIQNEIIGDLLRPENKDLKIADSGERGIHIKGLSVLEVCVCVAETFVCTHKHMYTCTQLLFDTVFFFFPDDQRRRVPQGLSRWCCSV